MKSWLKYSERQSLKAMFFATLFSSLILFGCASSGGGDDDTAAVAETLSVSSVLPADGATDVAINTIVSVTFNKDMSADTMTTNIDDDTCSGSLQLSSDDFSTCIQMNAVPETAGGDRIFTVVPASSLDASNDYIFKITTDVTDADGVALESEYISVTGFTTDSTSDTTTPGISTYDPEDAEINVAADASISITFDKAMNASTLTTNTDDDVCSGSLQLATIASDFDSCVQMAATLTISDDYKTVTLSPAEDMSSDGFNIRVTTSAKDAANNAIDATTDMDTGFNVPSVGDSSDDSESPTVSSSSPDSGETMDIGDSFNVCFSEAMDIESLTSNTADDECTGSVQVSNDSFSTCVQMAKRPMGFLGNTCIFVKPAANLDDSTSYELKVTTDVSDASENNLETDYEVSFDTAAAAVATLSLNKSTLTIDDGATGTISATATTDGSTADTVTAESDDTGVATVSVSGSTVTVAGESIGTAIITVTSGSGETETCTVTVEVAAVSAATLTLDNSTLAIDDGDTGTITATATTDGTTADTVTAASSDTSVATVSVSGLTITVTGASAGTATITVTSGSGETSTCTVTVAAVSAATLSLSPSTLSIVSGATGTITATATTDGTTVDTVTAESSDNSVATVVVSGLTITVTGVAAGTATITVTSGSGETATRTVTVSAALSDGTADDPVLMQLDTPIDGKIGKSTGNRDSYYKFYTTDNSATHYYRVDITNYVGQNKPSTDVSFFLYLNEVTLANRLIGQTASTSDTSYAQKFQCGPDMKYIIKITYSQAVVDDDVSNTYDLEVDCDDCN